MYLAPLNYDRYFKKVFSNIDIAKRFLEDFLDVQIQEITPMPAENRITDAARVVEFDFRCKIAGSYIIIDMQQWYKPDVVYRFYTYHCLNTALQLENLPVKQALLTNGRFRDVKDYSGLEPVITIIWMVDDHLGFSDDYIGYIMLPEKVKRFFEETEIWKNKDIENRVKGILDICNNNTKGLEFLQKNRLIFAFQKNIVKNKKFTKYSSWFTLAEKTLNNKNKKSDFDIYRKDEIFKELMHRLLKSNLSDNDLEYIRDYAEKQEGLELYNEGMRNEGRIEGIEKGIEQEKKRSREFIKQVEAEKQQAKAEKQQAKAEKQQAEFEKIIIKLYYKDKKSIDEIAGITGKNKEDIKKIIEM